jgi:translation initiation factor 5B
VGAAVKALRQPILSLLGHVDHGKTTLLDRITGAARAAHEPGGITQHIGAFEVSRSTILRLSQGLLRPDQATVPGILFIDTPGHRSFETMRRRGGALADLAVLVVDIQEGIMPQTRESIQILRHEKTPFAVALTKIDLLPGWRDPGGGVSLASHLERCGPEYRREVDSRLYAVAEELLRLGFSAERYDRVSDFTRNLGLVPISARAGVGIAELVTLIVGLSQRFLERELELVVGSAEGTILERSDQKGLGPVASVIVYRGVLRTGEEIVITGDAGPFTSRVRGLYRPAPIRKGRGTPSRRLEGLDSVTAAAGVYLSAPEIEKALPGGLFKSLRPEDDRAAVLSELARESQPVADLAESGVAITADTLGGLEAMALECREANVPVHVAEIGPVHRALVVRMATVRDPVHRAILAFSVPVLPDASQEAGHAAVRVFSGAVMYQLLEQYESWRDETRQALEKERRQEVVHPAKLQVLPGYVFRHSRPAIVGVRVIAGTLRPGVRLMHVNGQEAGILRSLQQEGQSVKEAPEGTELAASIDGPVLGRTLQEGDCLLVSLSESTARALRSQSLTDSERAVYDEVVRLRRSANPFWAQ